MNHDTPINRRRLMHGGAQALTLISMGVSPLATANDTNYPSRPITLLVPWPAGGATDVSLRLLADLAGSRLGVKVLVDNRSGAGGTLAMPVLQSAAPDGYTIAQMPQTVFRAPHMQKLNWDPIRDTTPILQLTGTTFGVVVPADSPLKSIDDVFALAKQRPGELTIATNGVGTTPHIVMSELFAQRQLRFVHVPYKGVAEQMLGVASGQVMVGVGSTGLGPFIDNSKLRLLATLGERRSRRWPGTPTFKELGLGIVAQSPYGLAGPAHLPSSIVTTLHDAFRAALQEPSYIQELAKYEQEPAYLGTSDYARWCREQFELERQWVERLNLKAGQ